MFHRFPTAVLLAALASTGLSAGSQESKSAPLAKELTQVLDAAKIDTIAAADPSSGGFVAALYIPGTQLLVVSGRFEMPDIGTHRLSKGEFRELYMDLMGASLAGSRQFASDVACDGFTYKSDGDYAADTWENGGTTHAFEGHKKAKISEADYLKAYTDADAKYAAILHLLLAQAKAKH